MLNDPFADEGQDTWEQVIRDLQAKQSALISLLIEKGVFSEEEFQRARYEYDRLIEEEKTRRIDQRNEHILEQLRANVRTIYEAVCGSIKDADPRAAVDIFRAETSDMEGHFGTIFVRIVTTLYADVDPAERIESFQRNLGSFAQSYQEHVVPLLLTPDEKAQSASSLQFDMMIELHGLRAQEE